MRARLNSWITHTTLATICLISISDARKPSDRDPKDMVVLFTSLASVLLGSAMVTANCVERLNRLLIGNICELLTSLLLVVLWLMSVVFLHNPNNEMATIVSMGGLELITYANLYFSGWFSFFSAVFLISSIYRDKEAHDPKLRNWFLLFSTSMILMGTSSYLHDDICNDRPGVMCNRTNFAIAIGAIAGFTAAAAILCLTCMKQVNPLIDLVLSGVCAVFYFFGVTILTSASGPARSIGTMYFAVWGGAGLSWALFVTTFKQLFLIEESDATQVEQAKLELPAMNDDESATRSLA